MSKTSFLMKFSVKYRWKTLTMYEKILKSSVPVYDEHNAWDSHFLHIT
jgi:hypothetical protein